MSVHRRSAICREGYQYLLLLVFTLGLGILLEANLLLVVAGMLFGPLLLNWRFAAKALRRVDVQRRVPQAVIAGEPLTIGIQLSNSRKRFGSWAVRVQDVIRREDRAKSWQSLKPELFFSRLHSGESRRLSYRACLPQRGRYRLGPIRVSTRFPFGLVKRTLTLARDHSFTVLPRPGRLLPAWNVQHAEDVEGWQGGQQPTRASGDFFGVREWQSGDSVRWIHWRGTARHNQLMVRQFEKPRRRDLVLLLDLWQPDKPEEEHLENVELAVSFAATVAEELCARSGGHVTLGIAGPTPVCLSGPVSTPLRKDALEALALAEATDEDHLPPLFDAVMGEIAYGTRIWLVSTRDNDLGDEQRFPCLHAGRGRQMVASGISTVNTAAAEFAEYFRPE